MNSSISPSAVRAQLRKILLSEAFVRSRRMQRFLEFIVEETLAGRGDQLGEYCIGTEVFDREVDFEPALDPIVRVDARRLRVKLLEYYSPARPDQPDDVLIQIPKGCYVPIFTHPVCRDKASLLKRATTPRLTVLPFETLSAEPEVAMFSRALCMSLTVNLTNLEGLEAIAHGYLSQQSVREAASDLNVSHVINGSILKSRDHCRVFVNLIEVPDGKQMWAGEYDFEVGQLFSVQSTIGTKVLREVTVRLGLPVSQPKCLHVAA